MRRRVSGGASRGRAVLSLVAVSVLVSSAAGLPAGSAAPVARALGRYLSPVQGKVQVINPFDAPPNAYAAGHRGVDLALASADSVLAAGGGTVAFAGQVAGRGLIVIRHPDGISTEYEPVTPLVRPGQAVVAGQRIAVLAGAHRGCPVSCLHWGARRDGVYFDPLDLLHPLGAVRLMPCQARGWAC